MLGAVVEIVFVIVVAGIAAVIGWCLRSGVVQRDSRKTSSEIRCAREVLGRLHELAAHVAADVGEHTSRVEEINEELLSSAAHETEAVVSAVDKLLRANNRMQEQLTSADEKLQEQARLIESHAAEARTDALTGLANRRAFNDEMDRRFAESQRLGRTFSVAMIDVDHFKRLNDTYGHQAGDAVLADLAGILRGCARQMDLVARYGGEEFAMILPGSPLSDAGSAAERIREATESTAFNFQGTDLHVTVSAGVAELLAGEQTAGLIRRADAALYGSKQAGRNCVCRHDGHGIQPLGHSQKTPSEEAGAQPARAEEAQQQAEFSDGESSQGQPAARPAAAEPVAAPEPRGNGEGKPSNRAQLDVVLHRRLGQWRRGGPPLSVLLVRVDRFRQITSDHGQQAGELVLRTVWQLLNTVIQGRELLVRYDAATLAVLLSGANLAPTVGMAERLREAIAGCSLPVERGQLRFTVSVSAAAAMDDDDAPALLRRAEEALNAAFKSGGDCSYFHNGQWSEIARATVASTN